MDIMGCIQLVWALPISVIMLTGPVTAKTLVVESSVPTDSITCWTCPNKTSNGACNDWAPEVSCPKDESVCRTVHQFERETGSSVLVNKECVAPTQCTKEQVGCWENQSSAIRECVTCCLTSYCNQEVAVDNDTALQLSVSILTSSANTLTSPLSRVFLVLVLGLSVT